MSDARKFLQEQTSFDYALGRMSQEDARRFELAAINSPALQEDILLTTMLVECVQKYALVCSWDSFAPEAKCRG